MTSKLRSLPATAPAVAGTKRPLCSSITLAFDEKDRCRWNRRFGWIRRAPTASYPPSGTCFAGSAQHLGAWRAKDERGRQTTRLVQMDPPNDFMLRRLPLTTKQNPASIPSRRRNPLADSGTPFPSHSALTIPTGALLLGVNASFARAACLKPPGGPHLDS